MAGIAAAEPAIADDASMALRVMDDIATAFPPIINPYYGVKVQHLGYASQAFQWRTVELRRQPICDRPLRRERVWVTKAG
jgi:hypothetical protein